MANYTIGELESLSGIDRRTIAYYVQQGLLPRVGRRGARTRYPQHVLDRLRFVVCVRRLHDDGALPPTTLDVIARVLSRLDVDELSRLATAAVSAPDKPIARPVVERIVSLFATERDEPLRPGSGTDRPVRRSTSDRESDHRCDAERAAAVGGAAMDRHGTAAMLDAFASLVEALDRRQPAPDAPRRIHRCRVTPALSISVEIGDRAHGVAVEECARSLALLLRAIDRKPRR